MSDPRSELADIVVPAAPEIAATGSSLLLWGAAGLAVMACIVLAAWLWQRRRPARALRGLTSAVALQQDAVQVLAARLDAWTRARYRLPRVDPARCPSGVDPAAWADWAAVLTHLRFAPPQPDGYTALAALCDTARAWQRHV
ncbi:MAG: hypothetical protein K0M66_04615 [Thiobacillus sp.]|nr:hypothetical protein [Thiobacillus sp.]